MSKSVEALAKPELLIWAREHAHIPEEHAAQKLNISPEKLTSWEAGEARPTVKQLRKMAKLYRQSFAAFYLPEPPVMAEPSIRDYRRFPGATLAELPPVLNFEIHAAFDRRVVALELLEEVGQTAPVFEPMAILDEDPELLGTTIREVLKVKYEQQSKWHDNRIAFNYWRASIESVGILVFQASNVELAHMRGFSLSEFPLPIIVVNRKDSYAGRVFTMLHELAHIVLRTSGICDLEEDEPGGRPEEQTTEVFCNHFAGACLVPKEYLLSEDIVVDKGRSTHWSGEEIEELSLRYSVSREVILRRFLILRLIDQEFYRIRRDELLQEYQQLPKTKGFAPPSTEVVSTVGKPFIRLVLDAFSSGRITSSDVADYLGVRLKHLHSIQQAVTAP